MVNENLISTLEQSLRQIRQSRTQKVSRLREIEGEADNLKQEVAALDSSSEQIEKTIHSLLFSVRSNKNAQKQSSRAHERELEMEMMDYDDDALDLDEIMTRYPPPQKKSQPNYASRSVVPMHRSGGSKNDIPSANPDVEVRSYRFRDRTITQACSVLMRESGRSLHVNEIYNRLLEGGMNFTGNNPTISIAVSLNRNRYFRKVAPGTFDLVMRDASHAAS
jgi:hypothetical protein